MEKEPKIIIPEKEPKIERTQKKERWYGNAGSGRQEWHDLVTTSEIIRNENGNIISEVTESPFNYEERKTEYTKDGLPSKILEKGCRYANWNNTPVGHTSIQTMYQYDEQKRLVKKTRNPEGSPESTEDYEYDSNGRISVIHYYDGSSGGVNVVRYEYDRDGNPVKRTSVELDDNGKENNDTKAVQTYKAEKKEWEKNWKYQ